MNVKNLFQFLTDQDHFFATYVAVACWPLVPKFAGSNPAKPVGFLRAKKNPQRVFLRRGSKAVGPMS